MDLSAARTWLDARGKENEIVDRPTGRGPCLTRTPEFAKRVAWQDHDIMRLPGGDPRTSVVRFQLPKVADYIRDLWVKVVVDPARYKIVDSGTLLRAVPVECSIGGEPVQLPLSDLALIKRVQLRIGNNVVEEITGDDLVIQRILRPTFDPATHEREAYQPGDEEIWVKIPLSIAQGLPCRSMEQTTPEIHVELSPDAPRAMAPRRAHPKLESAHKKGLLPEQMFSRYMTAKEGETRTTADAPVPLSYSGGQMFDNTDPLTPAPITNLAYRTPLGSTFHFSIANGMTGGAEAYEVIVRAPAAAVWEGSLTGTAPPQLVLTATPDPLTGEARYAFHTGTRNDQDELRTDFTGTWRILLKDVEDLNNRTWGEFGSSKYPPFPDYTDIYKSEVDVERGAYEVLVKDTNNNTEGSFYIVTTPQDGLSFVYRGYNGGAFVDRDGSTPPLWPSYVNNPSLGDLPQGIELPVYKMEERVRDGEEPSLVPVVSNGVYRTVDDPDDPVNPVGTVKDVRLVARYLYMDTPAEEQTDMSARFLEYQRREFRVEQESTISAILDMTGAHCDIIFFWRPDEAENPYQTVVNGRHFMKSAALHINGRPLHSPPRPPNYFARPTEYARALRMGDTQLYAVPFGFDMRDAESRPSGSLNFDEVDRVELRVELPRAMSGTLHVVGRRYNVMRAEKANGYKVYA